MAEKTFSDGLVEAQKEIDVMLHSGNYNGHQIEALNELYGNIGVILQSAHVGETEQPAGDQPAAPLSTDQQVRPLGAEQAVHTDLEKVAEQAANTESNDPRARRAGPERERFAGQ